MFCSSLFVVTSKGLSQTRSGYDRLEQIESKRQSATHLLSSDLLNYFVAAKHPVDHRLRRSTLPDPMTQAQQISQHYNLRRYGAKLAGIYAKTAGSKRSPVTYLDPDLLLDQFLDPARFCFLRT